MTLFPLRGGSRLASSMAVLGMGAVIDSARVVVGYDLLEIRPRAFRHLLLTFDDSIQGNIPAILGDDHDERINTLVRLLRGTSDDDLEELLAALQVALERLADETRVRCDAPSSPVRKRLPGPYPTGPRGSG